MSKATEKRAGFALPAVLGLTAVLSLVMLAAAAALATMTDAARQATDAAEFERAALGAEAQALMLTATMPFAADGLRVDSFADVAALGLVRPLLRLDGHAYVLPGLGGLTVSLQDEAGLVNLDATRPDALLRLLARLRLSQAEAETLRDRLLDALDADDRTRPRGLEGADYRARGLRPPPSGGFTDLAEVAAVPGWEALAAGVRRRELAALAVADLGSTAFNLNTAPTPVLEVVLGITPETAARVMALRNTGPLRSLAQVGLPAGAPGGALKPNGRVRFAVADRRRGLVYVSRLAPNDAPEGPPWYASAGLLTREVADAAHAAPLALPTDPAAPR